MFSGIVQRLHQFFGVQNAIGGPDASQETLEDVALRCCSVTLRKKVDVKEIIPHLRQRNLLMESDVHALKSKSNEEGVDHLVSILPKKKDGWWDELIANLKCSSTGTAHSDLVNLLERKIAELQKSTISDAGPACTTEGDRNSDHECDPRQRSQVSLQEALLDVQSGITRAVCALAGNPFMFSREADSKRTIEDHTGPLQNKLEEVEHKYEVIVNQVKLINLHEHLMEKSEKFGAALSEVLQLYVDHYKKKASNALVPCSKSDAEMMRIIETATECTRNIDMDKERKGWKECLADMHKQLLILKEKLFSIDINEMVKLQEAWSLRGDEEEKAREWIEERRKVIEAGKKCLIELEEICKGDDASDITKNVCRAIQNRLETGESCLNAWVSWIDHRTNLSK